MTQPLFSDMLFISGGSSGGGGGGTGDVKIDNVTITKNNSNKLQAVGQIEKRANNYTFDWIGTYSEYSAGISGNTIPSNYICYITDDTVAEGTSATAVVSISSGDTVALESNTIYNGGELSSISLTFPTTLDNSFLCEIDFTSGSTATTLAYLPSGTTIKWFGDDIQTENNVKSFVPETNKRYTIMFSYDGVNLRGVVSGV